ncbi:MAG: 3-isopropylmalate dehydratase small subunit [Alphaproteobacteria bacterium]
MQPFTTLTSVAVPMLVDNINTDLICPSGRPGKEITDYKAHFFWRRRLRDDGSEDPEFILNQPQFHDARILVTGHNFGCGSSRETAVWALVACDIRCVIARSFAEYFRQNCLHNGVLPLTLPEGNADRVAAVVLATDGQVPITVDLQRQRIVLPDGSEIAFALPEADRICLLEGVDNIGMTLKYEADIVGWERRMAAEQPWMQALCDSRLKA